ncbi:MAG: general secretion pathway protein GspB [FCB group bacterium]|nr:general secretion pathway protein GspB [FCB group bacterium]
MIVLVVSLSYLGYDMMFNKTPSTKELVKKIESVAKKSTPNRKTSSSSGGSTPVIQPKTIQATKAEKIPAYATVWGRDPFMSTVGIVKVKSEENIIEEDPVYIEDYILSAISFRGDRPVVLINESILKVGDRIDGLQLKEVRPNSVVLVSPGGKEYILNLQTTTEE